MSQFKVEVVRIDKVESHPNADRLDIVAIDGQAYRIVTQKGSFLPGDRAVYFPIDSVVPEALIDLFGIRAYYSKKLRAAKLRGIFSEGLLISPTVLGMSEIPIGEDLTEKLGITKYEYPIPVGMAGDAEGVIPAHLHLHSPENIKRFPQMFVPQEAIVITEKLHGTTCQFYRDSEDNFHAGSHNYFWKIDSVANSSNVYVRAFKQYEASIRQIPINTQLFGEIIGVQDLKYGLTNGRIAFHLFAASIGGAFIDLERLKEWAEQLELPLVPILYVGVYDADMIGSFNNADSVLTPGQLMEGVVITPKKERTGDFSGTIKRLCLKSISERYLLRKEGTEYH
jgi:RNA ligase (TIGR02306 family)